MRKTSRADRVAKKEVKKFFMGANLGKPSASASEKRPPGQSRQTSIRS
jgi:hypothetical protein